MKTKRSLLFTALMVGMTLTLGSFSASAADVKPYTMKVCLVSGNELGSMGNPITKTYDGQEIKFCCKPCIKKFEANPAKYLSKLK